MNKFQRTALSLGSAAILLSSLAGAVDRGPPVRVETIPNGNWGDPGVATLVETSKGATIELGCSNIVFAGGVQYDENYGLPFVILGEKSSNLPGIDVEKTAVTGSVTVTQTASGEIESVSIEVIEAGTSSTTYKFELGASGVGARCG